MPFVNCLNDILLQGMISVIIFLVCKHWNNGPQSMRTYHPLSAAFSPENTETPSSEAGPPDLHLGGSILFQITLY